MPLFGASVTNVTMGLCVVLGRGGLQVMGEGTLAS